jgi:hypothetical protein
MDDLGCGFLGLALAVVGLASLALGAVVILV